MPQSPQEPRRREFARSYEPVAAALLVWVNLHIVPQARSRVDPDDVIQEVWCRAYQQFSKYDPERGSFRGWVFGIAENVLLEEFRRCARGQSGAARPSRITALPAMEDLAAELTSIGERAARNESVQRLLAEAGRLSEEDQRLLMYRGLEGQTHVEAARRLGIEPEAARSRWRRLKEQLKWLAGDSALLADSA